MSRGNKHSRAHHLPPKRELEEFPELRPDTLVSAGVTVSELGDLEFSESQPQEDTVGQKSPAADFGSRKRDKRQLHNDGQRLFQDQNDEGNGEASWDANYDTKYRTRTQAHQHSERDGSAFASVALPAHFSVITAVLDHVKRRLEPQWRVERIIDWGAGTGSGLWSGAYAFQEPHTPEEHKGEWSPQLRTAGMIMNISRGPLRVLEMICRRYWRLGLRCDGRRISCLRCGDIETRIYGGSSQICMQQHCDGDRNGDETSRLLYIQTLLALFVLEVWTRSKSMKSLGTASNSPAVGGCCSPEKVAHIAGSKMVANASRKILACFGFLLIPPSRARGEVLIKFSVLESRCFECRIERGQGQAQHPRPVLIITGSDSSPRELHDSRPGVRASAAALYELHLSSTDGEWTEGMHHKTAGGAGRGERAEDEGVAREKRREAADCGQEGFSGGKRDLGEAGL
ncbi:hypothetical protein B0H11DRAFT_1941990 [Mycena galericulata]|nr:hypothetical protein B0H11DRAFT_1941990 [Mycena galericulata]